MLIPDPIEQIENRIERMADDLYDERSGKMRCVECRKLFEVHDLYPAYNAPDAPPVCRACLEYDA